MKCQDLFSGKNRKKYFKMLFAENFFSMQSVLQVLFETSP